MTKRWKSLFIDIISHMWHHLGIKDYPKSSYTMNFEEAEAPSWSPEQSTNHSCPSRDCHLGDRFTVSPSLSAMAWMRASGESWTPGSTQLTSSSWSRAQWQWQSGGQRGSTLATTTSRIQNTAPRNCWDKVEMLALWSCMLQDQVWPAVFPTWWAVLGYRESSTHHGRGVFPANLYEGQELLQGADGLRLWSQEWTRHDHQPCASHPYPGCSLYCSNPWKLFCMVTAQLPASQTFRVLQVLQHPRLQICFTVTGWSLHQSAGSYTPKDRAPCGPRSQCLGWRFCDL